MWYALLLCGLPFLHRLSTGAAGQIGLFRAVENFMVQFGLSGDPAVSEFWARRAIPDDTQWMPKGPRRFRRGFISFAGGGEASRTTQLFIAYNNLGLGDAPHEVKRGLFA